MEKAVTYKASDGKIFNDINNCVRYDMRINNVCMLTSNLSSTTDIDTAYYLYAKDEKGVRYLESKGVSINAGSLYIRDGMNKFVNIKILAETSHLIEEIMKDYIDYD